MESLKNFIKEGRNLSQEKRQKEQLQKNELLSESNQLKFDFGEEFNTLIVEKPKKIQGKKIVKEYKDLPIADYLRFGNEFVDEFFLGKDANKITINALKIIFNIISQLRNAQFQSKDPEQLSLFEEEFGLEDNLYGKIKIKNSLITRNSNELKKTYEFLAKYKMGWYKFVTSDGRKIESFGGLISNIFYEERGYSTFLISSYWMKRLIQIDSYNRTLYSLVYNVRSNKHILFYFWLNKLPMEGTKIRLNTLNEYFDLDYKTPKDICNKFLSLVRKNLNSYSDKSFNYNWDGEMIIIKPYLVQYVADNATKKETTKEKIKEEYKLRYYKDRHKLNEREFEKIAFYYRGKDFFSKKIISKAYKRFITFCRENKKLATSYVGEEFLEILQIMIEKEYGETKQATCWAKCLIKIY